MATAQMNGLLRYVKRLSMAGDRASVTDGDLLKRFLATQDEDAFEALVRRHGPAVLAICRQVLGNAHDAEDAFQATFLVLLHKARTLSNPEVVGSWLCGTAYFTAKNARVGIARRRKHEERATNMAPSITTERTLTATELQPILEELARLPEKLRESLMLCDLNGASRTQAARLLNCPEGTLSSRLARGRAMLRNRLTKRGFQLSLSLLAASSTRETLRASLPPSLVASTMRTLGAWLAGDVALTAKIAGNAMALTNTVLYGLAANKLHTVFVWLVGLATLGGTGVMVQQSLFATNASASSSMARDHVADQPTQPLLDTHGDALPPGAIARLGTVRWRPGNEVTAIAFSPDGSKIACGPIYSNVVQIWDRASGRLIQEYRGHRTTIMQIEFAGAGNVLISSSLDKTVRIWDTATGRERQQLPTPWPGNFCLTYDGRTLAMSNADHAIHLWDASTGKELKILKVGMEASIRDGFDPIALAFSPDGKRLATSDQEFLRVWDVTSGRLESSTPNGPRGQPRAAYFDGANVAVVSTAYNAPCTLWMQAPGAEPRTLRVEPAEYALTAFAPNGRSLLFSSFGQGVRLWDTWSGKELKRFPGMQGDARAVAYSRDGKLVAAGTAGSSLHVWDIASGKELSAAGAPAAALNSVAVTRKGQFVATTSADGGLHVWDLTTSKQRWQWAGSVPTDPTSVAIAPDGSKLVAGGLAKGIQVFDVNTGKVLTQFLTTESPAALGFSKDGETVVCTHDGRSVRWWDLKTGRERSHYPEPHLESLEYNLLSQFGSGMRTDRFPCAAVSPDGKLVALGNQKKISCVREDGPGKVQVLFEAQVNSVSCLAFSPDAKVLASGGDDLFVLLWDVASGKPVRQLDAGRGQIRALACSPDGKLLAAGTSMGKIILWDLATGKRVAERAGHLGAIQQLAFTEDSKLLTSAGGTDTTALIWDVAAVQR
jgi:RNA polymerase sigma factor (sigma-70 family)